MIIDQDRVPSSIEDAVDLIMESLDDIDRQNIINNPNISAQVHHSIGTNLRNSWSLWSPDTPLKRDAVNNYQIAHADDISGLILDWVCTKVRGESFDPMKTVQRFHEHWERMGTNSLEAGGWPPKT